MRSSHGWSGSNYIPKSAINELEMWQEATFDPDQIDKELGWAEGHRDEYDARLSARPALAAGCCRAFASASTSFSTIASRHHIRPLFVLFDSCWDPLPQLGPQHPPVPGVHNSGWVQSPGAKATLADASQYPRLKAYVQGVVGAFAKDDRILGWDVWNEPGSDQTGNYPKTELKWKQKVAAGGRAAAAGIRVGARSESDAAADQRSVGCRYVEGRKRARRD